MNSWKKQWKKELIESTPKLKEEVKNETIPIAFPISKRKPRRIFWAIPSFAITVVLLFVSLWFILKPTTSPTTTNQMYLLDINPSIVFVTNVDGVVTSLASLNEDADVVLNSMDSLISLPISEALTKFIDTSAKLGYFDSSKQGDAVLVRGYEEGKKSQWQNISSSIETYFCTKGFYGVYVEEQESLQEFSKQLGMTNIEDSCSLAKQIQDLGTLYGNRGVTLDNVETIYKEYLLESKTYTFIAEEFKKNINSILYNANLLLDIISLNTKIMIHKDNPSMFLKDYWSVKHFFNQSYTKEFASLMQQMDTLLSEYESKYNLLIQSLQDVSNLLELYSANSLDEIKNLETLSLTDFLASPSKYISILKNIGIDISCLEDIFYLPSSLEDYQSQLNQLLAAIASQKELENKEFYEKKRDSIDNSSYELYIEKIKIEYGSLLNYWNVQKK